jgi:peroxiredoxin Q/BCP
LIAALGAAEGGKTKRSHFVFAKGGKLVDKKVPVRPSNRYVTVQVTEYSRFF